MSSFSGGDDGPSVAEWAVLAVSVAVTLLLFGYVAWHAGTAGSEVRPTATVTGTQPLDGDRLAVEVAVYNPENSGLRSITVSVDCANESIEFEHVPIGDRRRGTVVCPQGSANPAAEIHSWVEA